jgi:hypothetical protein
MTNEEAIVYLISSESGHCVEIFGLSVFQMDDLTYAVCYDNETSPKKEWELSFTDPVEAAKVFEAKRKEMKLGFEFERIVRNG